MKPLYSDVQMMCVIAQPSISLTFHFHTHHGRIPTEIPNCSWKGWNTGEYLSRCTTGILYWLSFLQATAFAQQTGQQLNQHAKLAQEGFSYVTQ